MTTRIISGPGVWMEGAAVAQLEGVARLPGCAQAVGMPDLHAGSGPVGAAFLFTDGVHPALIGGDAGCGVRVLALDRVKASGDALERRVREAMEGPALPEVSDGALLTAAWARGPAGLVGLDGAPEALQTLAAMTMPDDLPPSGPVPEDESWGAQAGTIGGGNHFLELGQVEERGEAAFVVLAHSGSRSLGRGLARRWERLPAEALSPEDAARYLSELAGVCRFAQVNRLLLTWRMLLAAGVARPERWRMSLDITHNTVLPTPDGWLHRKGAAPAQAGQPTVVLGSRGARSALMEGLGNPELLCSVAHGAGRKMSRQDAFAKLKPRYRRDQLTRTALGSRVICDDPQLLYEEHPDSYKPIEPVVEALEAAGAARRLAWFKPIITVKQ